MAKWPIPLTHRTEQLRRRLNELWRAGEIGAGGTSGPASNITSTDINNWDAAFGWGDHAAAGYLTSFTETDPVFSAAPAAAITSTDVNNWDAAFSWGDHAAAGYLTAVNWGDITGTLSDQTDLQNALDNKLESFTETDPTVPAHVKNITTTQIGNWDVAFDRSPTALTLAAGDILTLTREGAADLTADLSGLGGSTVPADSVGVDELNTDNTPTDGQVLAFNASTGTLVWVDPATSGTTLSLTSISPTSGAEAGGTTVTATGTFDIGAPISFTVGGTAATSPTVVDSTTATFDTPAGTGASNDVVATQGAQSDTLSGVFKYVTGAEVISQVTHPGTTTAGTGVLFIDAHRLGNAWWDAAAADGSDVRVKDSGGTVHPHVLRDFDNGRGLIVAEVPLGTSAATFDIVAGSSEAAASAPSFTGYASIYDFVESSDLVGTSDLSLSGIIGAEKPSRMIYTDWSPDVNDAHQGVAFDGTHYYVIDTTNIYKYDLTWTLVASNTSPLASLGTRNRLSDGTIHDGELWIGTLDDTSGTSTLQAIAVYNVSDLSWNRTIDVTGHPKSGHGMKSIFVHENEVYQCEFDTSDDIYVLDLSGAYQRTITVGLERMQGICRAHGLWWITNGPDEAQFVSAFDDTWTEVTWWGGPAWDAEEALENADSAIGLRPVSEVKGLAPTDDGIAVLADHGAPSHVHLISLSHGVSFHDQADGIEAAQSRDTTSTLSFEFYRIEGTDQRALASIYQSGSAANERSTVAIDNGNNFGTWESSGNGWIHSLIDPTEKTWHHAALVYDGSTRRLYLDGVEEASGTANLPAGVNAIIFGTEDHDDDEPFLGGIRNARYRTTAASAAEILLEAESAAALTYTEAT